MEVRFHRLASREYLKAYRWYAQRSERAADRFMAAVDVALDKVRENPYRWPKSIADIRRIRLRRYPYFIHFRIIDDAKIQVLAVAHGRRRFGYWQRRMRSA